jgi:hypothetical protein
MNSNQIKVVAISALAGFAAGAVSLWTIDYLQRRHEKPNVSKRRATIVESDEHLHWDPLIERRGIGDLIVKANHVAIIVSDVGRSLHFYVDVLGLQQIRRPNFDRHVHGSPWGI